ncbi:MULTISPECIES: hypothetical protein [unclassified Rhodococcus (in: high G+C Gram-positive bacteria)]|jgi:hypothetical protein
MEHLDEQFPLAPLDDHLIHQTPDPIRVAWSSDPRFYERYWNVFHDEVGDLLIAAGGTFYPNLDLAEAYAIVNYRGIHRSVRAFRPLGADRMDLEVGPIRPSIVEGLRRWRHVLAPNDWDISYDLDWIDRRRQVYSAAYGSLKSATPAGSQKHVTAGFEGFGDVTGWVQIGDVRVEWPKGAARGTRDRHWGIGRGVGGPGMHPGRTVKAGWKGGNWIWFDDFAIWGRTVLYDFGDPRPGAGRVVNVERRLRFEEDTKIFTEGVIDYTFDTGEQRRVHFERLGFQTAYMKCGLYGGSPETGLHHGEYVGEPMVEGDEFDVREASVRAKLSGLNEHHCRITCEDRTTTGILQPLEPDAYESCARGERGWAFL